MGVTVELRPITDDELVHFHDVEARGFGDWKAAPGSVELDRPLIELDRTIAAFDGDDLVATNFSFPFEMTLPGGAAVPVSGVSGVTVAATHRRQGILRRMMHLQLDDVARRGEPMAVLNASEASIYGRFGYGLAESHQTWKIDPRRSAFLAPVRDDLRLRLLGPDAARGDVMAIYDGWRRIVPGALSHSDRWWDCVLGPLRSWRGGGEIFVVVCEPGDDHTGGYAIYTIDNTGPRWTLEVRDLVTTDPDVEARLWRYVLDIDLVAMVVAAARPLDDPLRLRMVDPRQVRTTDVTDFLYIRIVDVAATLAARRYPVVDTLVLDVVDDVRPALGGRYLVAGGPDGATCERSDAPADLRLGVGELGSLVLGGVDIRHLAQVGRVVGCSASALDRAAAFFGWPVAPFCLTRF